MQSLGYLKAPEAVPPILAALEDPDSEVRLAGAYAAAELGPPARAAIPLLLKQVKALLEDVVHVEPPALRALGNMGEAARAVVPDLLPLRNHKSLEVRRGVERALSQIDPGQFPPKDQAK